MSDAVTGMEGCETRGKLYYHPLYLLAVVTQSASGLSTFVLLFLIFRNYALRLFYHPNVLLLLALTLFSCVVLAGITMFSATVFMFNLYTKATPCDMLMKTSFCSLARSAFLAAFCLLTISHGCILLERLWATYKVAQYERQGKRLGVILSIVSVGMSILVIFLVTLPEDSDELITSCLTFSASPSIGNNIYIMFKFQFGADIFIIILQWFLLRSNKKKENESFAKKLSEKYQRMENVKILQQTAPLVLSCSITIGIYISIISFVRIFKEYLPPNYYEITAAMFFVIPHIPTILTSLMYFTLRRNFLERMTHHKNVMISQENYNKDYFKSAMESWETEFDNFHSKSSGHSSRSVNKNIVSVM